MTLWKNCSMSSRSVRCLCIDDSNKPVQIPSEKWVKKGEWYNITHIFIMVNQGMIQGCELAEFDISMHKPYNCYRLTRFAILEDDLEKLKQMIKDCDELNKLSDIDVNKLVEQLELQEI